MSELVVLSQYPLSRSYQTILGERHGSVSRYATLGDLREGGFGLLLKRVRELRADRLFIALEDPTSVGALPILEMIAAAAPVGRIELVDENLNTRSISRWGVLLGAARFAGASLGGLASALKARILLAHYARQPRLPMQEHIGAGLIAYLNTNVWFGLKAGGSVGHISGVANGFMGLGYELTYLSVGGPLQIRDTADHHEVSPPDVFGLPFETNLIRFNDIFNRQATKALEGRRISFLYQRLSLGNFSGVTLSRRFKVPLIVEYNGSEVWVAQKWGSGLRLPGTALAAERQMLRHAHRIVTISEVLKDELLEQGIEPERIVAYPNCIDPQVFDPGRFSAVDRATIRAREGIPTDACVCTFVGTFGTWHGAEVFAAAIRRLCTDHRATVDELRLRFLLVGDGLRMKEVRKILDHPACRPYVALAGLVAQPEAPGYLASSDILVSPHVPNADGTRFFGSPTKLFEYMAMGKAIVASDLEQIGQVLQPCVTLDRVNGDWSTDEAPLALLLPPGDVEALAQGLVALGRDPALRERLGANARRQALERYTWESHVEAILSGLRDGSHVTVAPAEAVH